MANNNLDSLNVRKLGKLLGLKIYPKKSMTKTLIYDCEIANDPTVVGWRNFEALGLTVVGTWRNWPIPRCRAYRCDRREDFDLFQKLASAADEIVGFNSHNFDRAGYSLDRLAIANLGRGKTGREPQPPNFGRKENFFKNR